MPDSHMLPERGALSALALVGQVGLVVAVGVVGGVVAGAYLDRLAGTGGIALVGGVLMGIAAGLYGAYRIIAKEIPWNR